MSLVSVYYPTFLGDTVPVLRWHQEAFDGISSSEMDLDTYLTTKISDTFTETLSTGNHHMNVVVVGVIGAGVITPGTGKRPMCCCV